MPKNSVLITIGIVSIVAVILLVLSFKTTDGNTQSKTSNKSNLSTFSTTMPTNKIIPSSTLIPTTTPTNNITANVSPSPSQCNITYKPTVKKYSTPPMCISQDITYTGVIKTSMGDISIELTPQTAPQTVNSFYFLAKSGFFDGLTFHRVVKDFVIQGGDPNGNGTGGPGYQFNDEIKEGANNVVRGVLAMANSGPNTNGSQFFIPVTDQTSLNTGYTVFGKVTSGMDVVDKIDAVQVDANSKPLTPVTITSIQVNP